MAFTAHSLQRLTSKATGKSDPAINYNATWRLHGWDDPNSSPTFSDVYSYLRSDSSLPYAGRTFKHGAFSDASAWCVELDPEPVLGSQDSWDVRATFESDKPPKQEQPGQDGRATEDPFKWRRECSVSFSQTSIAIESAIFRGFSQRGINNRFLRQGTRGPIVNSALQELEVQHLKESDQQTISVSKYVPRWRNDTARHLIGAVNNAAFQFQLQDLDGEFNFPALTLKVRNFGATSEFINNKKCWRQNIELLYNPEGWRLEVLDRGFSERRFAGDHKPDGTVVSNTDVRDNGKYEVLVDENGNPTALPQMLNGDGQRLPANQPPVYLIYQIYERELDFAAAIKPHL